MGILACKPQKQDQKTVKTERSVATVTQLDKVVDTVSTTLGSFIPLSKIVSVADTATTTVGSLDGQVAVKMIAGQPHIAPVTITKWREQLRYVTKTDTLVIRDTLVSVSTIAPLKEKPLGTLIWAEWWWLLILVAVFVVVYAILRLKSR